MSETGRVPSCTECAAQHYEDQRDTQHNDLVAIMAALGIGDYARPYSSHAVVWREVLPAIRRLTTPASVLPLDTPRDGDL